MTITSPCCSKRLRFPLRVELDSTSSDRSMTPSVEPTSFCLFDPRVVASTPSLVEFIPVVRGSVTLFVSAADCALARPFPLVEVRRASADAPALFTEEGGLRGAAEGDRGGGGGLAYSSVHCRALLSCIGRLRRNSVAIDGTG
jgi:hypothetical protein